MTRGQLTDILGSVKFRDWKFRVMEKGDGFLVQVVFTAPDCEDGCPKPQRGRKWYVSSHACRSEVVQTAYAAVQRAILHEVAEDFLFKGRRIFDPHLDVEALVDVADCRRQEVRDGLRR